MKRSIRRPSAFVLVLVLAAVVISSIVCVGLARRSLHYSLLAATAQADLQTRHAKLGLQQFLLQNAPTVLGTAARKELAIQLGEESFRLVLADENQKQGLSGLTQTLGAAGVDAELRRTGLTLRRWDEGVVGRFANWGTVFDLSTPPVKGWGPVLERATRKISCWGNGAVASSGNASRLPKIDAAGSATGKTGTGKTGPTASACWSAWVFQGPQTELWVNDIGPGGTNRLLVFVW